MQQTIILSKSNRESGNYAKAVGIDRFTYRHGRNAAQIRATRRAEVHILPSFLTRMDRHAILASLAWAKGITVVYADWDGSELLVGAEPVVSAEVDPRGELTDRQLETAYRYHAIRELPVAEPEATPAAEPAKPRAPRKPRVDREAAAKSAAPVTNDADFFGS